VDNDREDFVRDLDQAHNLIEFINNACPIFDEVFRLDSKSETVANLADQKARSLTLPAQLD
jgi:hypothetical protein